MYTVMIPYVTVAYFVTQWLKCFNINKRWYPCIAALTGLICSIIVWVFCRNTSLIDSITSGILSGFAAVGTNEIRKYTFQERTD